MTEQNTRKKRTQNKPKKYKQKDPEGSTTEHRPLCPVCMDKGIEIQLKKTSTQYALNKKRKTVNAGYVCIECFHFVPNKEELKKIPK